MIILILSWLSLSVSALSQNLVAYYPFNGNNNDESGNGINATYTGPGVTLTADRFGIANKAYDFDGIIGSYMRMPADLLPTANRTVSLWFNVPSLTNKPFMLGYGGNSPYTAPGTSFLMGVNAISCGCYHTQGHFNTNAVSYTYGAAPVNQWVHWVVTINGATTKMYVNGNPVADAPSSFNSNTFVTGRDLAIGVMVAASGFAPYTDPNGGYFQGKLDDIRIYDNAMTDAQVQNLYNSELSNSEGLVAYFPFNGNSIDETGHGNNAIYTGGAGVTLTTDRFGNAGKAYHFDGDAASYIKVPADNFPATDRTISFWFNADNLSYSVPCPFSYGGSVCHNSLLMFINHYSYVNAYMAEAHCGDNVISSPYLLEPINGWYHLTLTISGTTQKIFINGVLQQTANTFLTPTYVTNTSALIGACVFTDGNSAWAGFFQGKLDEFRIYSIAMSDAQVTALHNAEAPGPLPVIFSGLQVNKVNATTVKLTWQTASEINNSGFALLRSFDGINFTDIKFVSGTGNSDHINTYSTTDIPGVIGRVYYKVKQIDVDGKSSLSDIVSIALGKSGMIKWYPNPAQQNIIVEGIANYKRLQILDLTGRLVKDIVTNNQYQLNIAVDDLKIGCYFIRLINEQETQSLKFIINR